MRAAQSLDDGLCHPIEHDQTFIAVLRVFTRDEEYGRAEDREAVEPIGTSNRVILAG